MKRRKTRWNKSRLVLVLNLIGWESGASFQNQPQGEVLAILSDAKAHIYLKFPYVLSFLPSWFVFSGG